MGIAHSSYADDQEQSVRRVEMEQVQYEEDDSECVHAGMDCETIEACSDGCDCGCDTRVIDDVAAKSKERFRNNIKEVVEKYRVTKSEEAEDGSFTTVYGVKEAFIQELYGAVGVQ